MSGWPLEEERDQALSQRELHQQSWSAAENGRTRCSRQFRA